MKIDLYRPIKQLHSIALYFLGDPNKVDTDFVVYSNMLLWQKLGFDSYVSVKTF